MADGTAVVSDRWGLPLVLARFVRGLSTHQGSGCPRRLRTAATAAKCHPRAGRLPSGRGPNADRPFDEPATSTARRVAAATWMMSSTTVASRAYAVVPARRSRWSRGGASRPSSAPAAGSARHRADASRRDRAARSQTHNLHRAGGRFGVAFVLARLGALDTAGVGAFPISRSRAHTHRRHGHPLQTVPSAGLIERPQEKNRVDALR